MSLNPARLWPSKGFHVKPDSVPDTSTGFVPDFLRYRCASPPAYRNVSMRLLDLPNDAKTLGRAVHDVFQRKLRHARRIQPLREEAPEVWRFLLGQLHGYRRAMFGDLFKIFNGALFSAIENRIVQRGFEGPHRPSAPATCETASHFVHHHGSIIRRIGRQPAAWATGAASSYSARPRRIRRRPLVLLPCPHSARRTALGYRASPSEIQTSPGVGRPDLDAPPLGGDQARDGADRWLGVGPTALVSARLRDRALESRSRSVRQLISMRQESGQERADISEKMITAAPRSPQNLPHWPTPLAGINRDVYSFRLLGLSWNCPSRGSMGRGLLAFEGVLSRPPRPRSCAIGVGAVDCPVPATANVSARSAGGCTCSDGREVRAAEDSVQAAADTAPSLWMSAARDMLRQPSG